MFIVFLALSPDKSPATSSTTSLKEGYLSPRGIHCGCPWPHSPPTYLYNSRSGRGDHHQKLLGPIKDNLHPRLSLKLWSLSLLFFCYFWYFNIITLLIPFFFSPLKPLIYPSLISFKFMISFYCINWSYEHRYTVTCIFLSIICSICIMLLVCLFPELTTGIRLGISVFPGENYFFCSQSSLVACHVLFRYKSRSEELLSPKHSIIFSWNYWYPSSSFCIRR